MQWWGVFFEPSWGQALEQVDSPGPGHSRELSAVLTVQPSTTLSRTPCGYLRCLEKMYKAREETKVSPHCKYGITSKSVKSGKTNCNCRLTSLCLHPQKAEYSFEGICFEAKVIILSVFIPTHTYPYLRRDRVPYKSGRALRLVVISIVVSRDDTHLLISEQVP